MKVSLYSLAWNEIILLPYVTSWYKKHLPEIELNLLDNESDDGTTELAKELGWNIYTFKTGGKFDDKVHRMLKNEIYKQSKNSWVIVSDFDELIQLTENQLIEEDKKGTTILSTTGYQMINLEDNLNIEGIKYGYKDVRYSKSLVFNKDKVDIGYSYGAHECFPKGELKFSSDSYKVLHLKYLNPQWVIDRYKILKDRVTEENFTMGHAFHYKQSIEQITNEFEQNRKKAVKIL